MAASRQCCGPLGLKAKQQKSPPVLPPLQPMELSAAGPPQARGATHGQQSRPLTLFTGVVPSCERTPAVSVSLGASQLVPETLPKNAYLSHSIRCHMRTVQKVTYNSGHRPAHELAQQCFLQSVVYSHNLNSKMRG